VTIIRVFRARAKRRSVDALERVAREHAIPGVAAADGLVAQFAGRPHGDSREFVMVSVWSDLDAVRAFAGDDYERPMLFAETEELIEEAWLHHYEVIE
jgi:quinol monooxygenase YgiN